MAFQSAEIVDAAPSAGASPTPTNRASRARATRVAVEGDATLEIHLQHAGYPGQDATPQPPPYRVFRLDAPERVVIDAAHPPAD